MEEIKDMCVICGKCIKNDFTVVKKGIDSLIEASKERKDDLWEKLENVKEILLHTECRKNYTRRSSIVACKRAREQGKTN